ncbi:kinesin-like protein KIN-6 isoform X1 [Triticum aestivum]|uniref:kinesin-like protein KIN-6 isoform X1 n=1 Tax=Triticum aestivum TaxID=4565 RepID=UPI001D01101F|nr:kinesin-like protein KIN-6 isoform X1 [Triticum aestivum]
MASPPPPPTTVRRNPPRRGRPALTPGPTPAPAPTPTTATGTLRSRRRKAPVISRLLDDEPASAAAAAATPAAGATPLPPPPPTPPDAAISPPHPPPPAAAAAPALTSSTSSQPAAGEERLKVYLRIRPLPAPERERGGRPAAGRARAKEQPPPPPKKQQQPPGVCLVATGPGSVALTVPQAKLVDHRRGRTATEVFDGFSAVLPPDSSQNDIFTQVMNPLVDEFLGGKSGLLVAMGPTGSGKTHTVFGTARNPGLVPLTLQKIFTAADESEGGNQSPRSFYLSMFEILCEGKGERILDLLSDAAELVLQQSATIKGLKEVAVSSAMDAESFVSRGMLKRSTAATDANSESSRSQCIITIRAVHKPVDQKSEHPTSGSVLTIADLAGAERKKNTGNKGSRLLESNFINNTSMVFGLCLRALLDHQKNQKKTLEKHFKNSMLTRYLKDYLEGRKKMTLILNVKPGEDDYADTSYLLRQASPYMKIRYTSLDESSDLVSQKRTNVSLVCQENKKRRKVNKPEPEVVTAEEKELQRVSRSEQVMKNLFNALWTVSKQKISESEVAAKSMRELLKDKDIEILELKKELDDLKSRCSHVKQNDAASIAISSVSQTDLASDAALDNVHLSTELVQKISEESTYSDPEMSSAYCDMTEKSVDCDTSVANLIDEHELSSRYLKKEESCTPDVTEPKCDLKKENTEIMGQVGNKESDGSESCSEQTSAPDGGVTHAPSHLDDPSELSYTELHIVPCNLSAQFTDIQVSEKAPMEQSEEEELSSNTEVESIQHVVDIKEMKQHDYESSSQQPNFGAGDVSSNQPLLELQGMENPDELVPEPEICEPTVKEAAAEHAHGRHVPDEGLPQTKASIAPTKDCQAEGTTDDQKENLCQEEANEDLCASKPRENTKKPSSRRRLLPVSAMMLKEFTGPAIDAADTKRATDGGGGAKASSGEQSATAAGRSDTLIRLLKAKAPPMRHRWG